MAAGFEFFKSTDAGAPVLTGQIGKMIAVLDWVLVTKGGWAKAFTGTNLAAYRSNTGNRFYLRVDDTQTILTRLRGYRAMTAISTGTNEFPATSVAAAATWGTCKSTTADATARAYWGIRTDRYVFLVTETADPLTTMAHRTAFAFGDVPSYCETDPFNTAIMGMNYPENGYFPASYFANSIPLLLAGTSNGVHMAATPDGTIAACATQVAAPFTIQGATYVPAISAVGTSGRLQMAEAAIYSGQSAANTGGATILRAKLPNVKACLGTFPRPGLAEGEEITAGGKTHKLYSSQFYNVPLDGGVSYAGGFFALEITDTDGAL